MALGLRQRFEYYYYYSQDIVPHRSFFEKEHVSRSNSTITIIIAIVKWKLHAVESLNNGHSGDNPVVQHREVEKLCDNASCIIII